MRRPWIHIAAVGALAALCLAAPARAGDDELPKAVGRAFIEAEAKDYIKTWVNNHPPVGGVTSFGAKTFFVLELLMAADDYRRADTDKQRFHAAAGGAVAFVAYSYAATPAVGLAVTAVWLCAQIFESAVAGSYAEAMLAIEKDIILTEEQREDLVFRSSLSRAYRILVLVDGVRSLMDRNADLEFQFSADCAQRAGSFDALAGCMDLLTRIVAQREALIRALDGLLALPDADLKLLGESSEEGQTPKKSLRERLQDFRNKAQAETDQVEKVYQPMASSFGKLAAAYMESEAIGEEQRLSAVEAVESSCRARRTAMSLQMIATIADLATNSKRINRKKSLQDALAQGLEIRKTAAEVLAEHAQISLACPVIARDQRMTQQMDLLKGELARPVP